MRIVALSDTHTKHREVQVPEGDILLFAGDAEFRTLTDLIEFNAWLCTLNFEEILIIAGSHDLFCERFPGEVKKYLEKAIYLKDEQYTLPNGMLLYASPMTLTFLNWAFMDSEENLATRYWNKIPRYTDILLTHGPAYGYLDKRFTDDKDHLGSKSLDEKINEFNIPYVIHGHIHGSYGIKKTDSTTYINCSVLDENYNLANKPIILDL